MSRVYLFMADGFEEVEGLTVVDILRRAGVETVTVSVTGRQQVTGSHNITITADGLFEEYDFADAACLVLPGGMPGTMHLKEHEGLVGLLKKTAEGGGRIGAICAAPSVLGDLGLLKGKKAVCYPGFEERLTGAEVLQETVVTDGNITTSRGLGTAIPFALRLTELLAGKEKAEETGNSIVFLKNS